MAVDKSMITTLPPDDLPDDLRLALKVYEEFWHELPENMRHPTKADVERYLTDRHGIKEKIRIDRIFTISRPPGPAKSTRKSFKIRSERK